MDASSTKIVRRDGFAVNYGSFQSSYSLQLHSTCLSKVGVEGEGRGRDVTEGGGRRGRDVTEGGEGRGTGGGKADSGEKKGGAGAGRRGGEGGEEGERKGV